MSSMLNFDCTGSSSSPLRPYDQKINKKKKAQKKDYMSGNFGPYKSEQGVWSTMRSWNTASSHCKNQIPGE